MISGTIAAPVTAPTSAALRKCWAPSRMALATVCSVPKATNAPANAHAPGGRAPRAAATSSPPPPSAAPASCSRHAQPTTPSASSGRSRPSASATVRINASPIPLVSTSSTDSETKAMKLWRPKSDGPRKRAPAIEIATT